jgi:short-subunit dehydrogenase
MNRNPDELYAIVTGTSRGLGFLLCQQLLQKGYFVTGFARSSAPSVWQSFIDNGRYRHIVADLSDLKNVELVFSEFNNHKIQMIILNAADYSVLPENNPKDFLQQLNLNLLFPVLFIQKVLSQNRDNRSKIVFVSSIMAFIADGKNPVYGAAKASVSHFIDGLLLGGNENIDFLNAIAGPLREEEAEVSFVEKLTSASYSKAAAKILRSAENGKKIIFVPGVWRYIIYLAQLLGKENMDNLINRFRKT